MKLSNIVVLAIIAVLSLAVSPWLGLLGVALVFGVGSGAVVRLKSVIQSYVPGRSEGTTLNMLDGILGALFEAGDDTSGASPLPQFAVVRSGRDGGKDFRSQLYGSPEFQALCKLISVLGPMPCLPGVWYLQRAA